MPETSDNNVNNGRAWHDPGRSELIADVEFESLIKHLCTRPSMYIFRPTVETVIAFLDGYDTGNPAMFIGFKEWSVVRSGGGDNINFTGHMIDWTCPGKNLDVLTSEQHKSIIASIGDVLVEFIAYRRKMGITKIFQDYANWLLKQDWYDGPLRASEK